jgi:arsenite-transporting ATPase
MLSHQLPEYLQNKDLQLLLFGGKGGVGKTTMAATTAIHLARSYQNDKKVLVISTDPAHSLSDSFELSIGDKITPIQWSVATARPGATHFSDFTKPTGQVWARDSGQRTTNNTNLYAHELDATRLTAEFKEKNEAVIKKLADRGTYFDQKDIAEFFNLSLPGMDEVMAIIEMAKILKGGSYDIVILDTAPTGHTVRMLNLPQQMLKWIEVMDLMQRKHRYMAAHFTGKKYVKDECDIFLENLSSDIEMVKKLLSDAQTTRFVPVTIPEPMSIYETKRLLSTLEKLNVPVRDIVVNRVVDTAGCSFCVSKKNDQQQPLSEIEDAFSEYNLIKVPVFPNEIRGVEELKVLADYLLGNTKPSKLPKAIQRDEEPQAHLALNPNLEFILFGGKGGVGKTSLASATAVHLAQRNPGKKVLVFSTDPAHSLSDSFKLSIGDKITPIQWSVATDSGQRTTNNTNLYAHELDADKLFEDFKQGYKKDIEELFDNFLGGSVDIKFDREVMMELLTLAPPGLDEIMALDTIMELREEGEFDIFVLDTSPTGHLLRFLELPDIIREWLKAFFRLLLKYKGVVRMAKAAEKALAMSKNIRRIQEILVDPERTAFVGVTIPEAMGFLELERLLCALDNAKIPCNHIAINMVVPQADCDFCSSKRTEQQRYIKKIHSRFPTRSVTKVPLLPHEVRGVGDLNKIGEIILGTGNIIANNGVLDTKTKLWRKLFSLESPARKVRKV